MRLYRHKVNRADDILPELEDADNHYIDLARYAFQPLIASRAKVPSLRLAAESVRNRAAI